MQTEIPPIPEAIADDEEAVKRFIATWQNKIAVDARTERDRLKFFQPVVDTIMDREGIAIDGSRLSVDERSHLRAIIDANPTDVTEGDGLVLRRRGPLQVNADDRADYEKLINQAAGHNAFKRRRDEIKREQDQARAAEKTRKSLRKKRPKYARPGTVQVPAFMFNGDWLGLRSEWGIVDFGFFVFLIGLIENYDGVINCVDAAEVHGDELVIDAGFFPGAHLKYGIDQEIKPMIDFLATNQLITVTKEGSVWRIRRGPALLSEEEAVVTQELVGGAT